jgi:hypothetical protein
MFAKEIWEAVGMSSKAERFAATVLAAFEAAGRTTDQEVAAAEGPSTTTMTKLRKVREGLMTMNEPRGDVLQRIDNAANWQPGSARALWRVGEEPRPRRLSLEKVAERSRRVLNDPVIEWLEELDGRVTELEEKLDLLAAGQGPAPEPKDYRPLLGDALGDVQSIAARKGSGKTAGQRVRAQQDADTENPEG